MTVPVKGEICQRSSWEPLRIAQVTFLQGRYLSVCPPSSVEALRTVRLDTKTLIVSPGQKLHQCIKVL